MVFRKYRKLPIYQSSNIRYLYKNIDILIARYMYKVKIYFKKMHLFPTIYTH